MDSVAGSIVINRPIEEVFDVATCLERCVVWRGPIISTEKLTDGAVTIGTTYRHEVKFLGITVEAQPVITAWNPPYTSEYKNDDGPIKYHGTMICESAGQGTKLTAMIDAQPQGAFRHIPETLVHRAITRQLEGDLQSLKELMESETQIKAH